jgi:hypothetical protein
MNYKVDRHFIYIISQADKHKQQIQSYYKMTEEDLEEITKEWSADLLIPVDPTEISDINILETTQDTPEPSKTNKNKEVHDLDSASVKTTSISLEQGVDGEELNDKEVKQ